MNRFVIAAEEHGRRLDHVIADHVGCSHAEARRLISEGRVRYRGKRAKAGAHVERDASVSVDAIPDKKPVADSGALSVLWKSDSVLAFNKPAGIATHPLRRGESGTLANLVVAQFPECAEASRDPREGGAAHRLDKETSGVILFGRSSTAWTKMRKAFHDGEVEKEYLALVVGEPQAMEIDAPVKQSGTRVRIHDDGASAYTQIEVLARGTGVALVRAVTSTGRMHQVRAHLAYAGHPLIGDRLYGGPESPFGHMLHAWRIVFPNPAGNDRITVVAPMPADRAAEIARVTGYK